MLFSISLVAAALFSSAAVHAAPMTKFTGCDLKNVVIPAELLVDSKNASNVLPPPTGSLSKLVLGVGSQNYSCEAGVPVANGAVAVLYDASCAADTTDLTVFNLITTMGLHANKDFEAQTVRIFSSMMGAQLTTGVHYFKGDFATPCFEFLDGTKFIGKAGGKVAAPLSADKGKAPDAYGAVPSLKLVSKDGMGSTYSSVYRLHTAGGTAPATCNWSGQRTIAYAALYYLYK